MATSVVMPALEMAQETGRLLGWRKQEGEAVAKGEPLMDVETDKAVVEVEAEADGILAAVRAHEGDVITVGQTIAWILAPGEAVPAEEPRVASGRSAPTPVAGPVRSEAQPTAVATGGRALMSPRARRLAAERGLDVSHVSGSGPGGALQAADLAAVPEPATDSIWRLMAERVTTSWTTVPQFFVTRDVDAGELVDLRERLMADRAGESAGSVTYTDVLVLLVARALRSHPELNASWVNGAVRRHDAVNIGVATAVDQGVVVPVIHGADRLPIRDLARRRRELVERARLGRLRPADIADGTFTISNLGTYDVQAFTAIVNAPQAAILAVGRISDRVVARDGRPVVRPQMNLTLSCDHRVADGARAAVFLTDLAGFVERPGDLA